jgi:hypothetical protein
MARAGSWDAAYLAEAHRRSHNLRKEDELVTTRLVAGSPRRHQVHFEEDQPTPNRGTQVQVGMIPEEYNQWKEFSQLAEFRLQEQNKLQCQTREQAERDKYLRQLADLTAPRTKPFNLTRPSVISEPW